MTNEKVDATKLIDSETIKLIFAIKNVFGWSFLSLKESEDKKVFIKHRPHYIKARIIFTEYNNKIGGQ